MDEISTDKPHVDCYSEAELQRLLAEAKVEPSPEADFDSRFLYDFHERIARLSVCRSARSLLWEHARQWMGRFRRRCVACGASTLGIGVLAVGFFIWPSSESETPAEAVASRTSSSFARAAAAKIGKFVSAASYASVSESSEERADESLLVGSMSDPQADSAIIRTWVSDSSGQPAPAHAMLMQHVMASERPSHPPVQMTLPAGNEIPAAAEPTGHSLHAEDSSH